MLQRFEINKTVYVYRYCTKSNDILIIKFIKMNEHDNFDH